MTFEFSRTGLRIPNTDPYANFNVTKHEHPIGCSTNSFREHYTAKLTLGVSYFANPAERSSMEEIACERLSRALFSEVIDAINAAVTECSIRPYKAQDILLKIKAKICNPLYLKNISENKIA